jgi:polyribonucleotide nucleotidyltransferase
MEKTHVIPTPEGDITLSTGKIATLAAGAVMVQKGGVTILATATVENTSVEQDFFPLTVEYLERYYASGVLSGSRFNKREGFPSEGAIIKARQIDHSIRPLFPKAFKKPVNAILTLLSDDGETDTEGIMVLAASIALVISGIPFAGPAASTAVGVKPGGELVINPPMTEHESFEGLFVVSGANGKVLNIEGWGKELSDDTMDAVLKAAMERNTMLNAEQTKFANGIAKPIMEAPDSVVNEEVLAKIEGKFSKELAQALFVEDKGERDAALTAFSNSVIEQLTADQESSVHDIKAAIDYASRALVRKNILDSDKRLSGRKLDEVRALSAEVDVLPKVHGSALFSRGSTQSLSITTLGSTRKSTGFNDMHDEDTIESFMHHYNFPPFSTGESGRVRYKPGRREIGHGAIGWNGLRNMLPSQDDFPYTIRVVSEIMTSNGSTSMAATCGASLSMMAAGVPMKAAVGGIGVGLVTVDDDQKDYKLLLDIEGAEDFYGDMDFKVTGTDKGLTAIQFETKLEGVRLEILSEAFRLASKGKQQVLAAMAKALSASRSELSPNAPRVEALMIPVGRIGDVIGPGGKIIKEIVAEAEEYGKGSVEIDINDDGRVTITAHNPEQLKFAKDTVQLIGSGPELNETYDATVVSVVDFGAFVEIIPGLEGLVHVSEIANERVNNVGDYLKVGDQVRVKLIEKKPGDKYSFSIKKVDAKPA